MKRHLSIAVVLLSSLLLCPPALFSQEPVRNQGLGIISVPLANVHDRPAPKSGLITQVLLADEVRILEKQDYRYRISIPGQENREGWIQQEAVYIPREKGGSYLSPERPWIVIAVPKAEALILDRTGDHKVSLYAGTRLPVLEKKANTYKVQFPDRSIAILAAADAIPVRSPDPLMNDTSGEDIARTAKLFLGVRHLDGGITAQGMDTRGLVSIVYRIFGYSLSTERSALKIRTERVAKKDVLPGDILFFNGETEGIYVGNGRFLHSPRKGTMQYGGMFEKRFAGSMQYGLRVIGADTSQTRTPAQMTAEEILLAQAKAARLPLGRRIAYWAGRFVGTPYDPDPLGLYVRTNRVVADEKVDCMYHTFRSVELAQSASPAEAVDRALALRFVTQGKVADGLVTNYGERFEYGEDMVFSNKWGRNVTAELGTVKQIAGSRGKDQVEILPKAVLLSRMKKLEDGDIVFWVKDPKKRSAAEEIVAHLSIVHVKAGKPYLIHAAGSKDRSGTPGGGVVKEVPFSEYVQNMRFIGAFITRFEQ